MQPKRSTGIEGITPVLMVPIRRCGSHALRLRLSASPDFYAPYPLHIVDFMPLVQLYGDLTNDDTYFQMVIDLVGLQNAAPVKWKSVGLDPVSIFDSIKDRAVRSPHVISWELLFQAGYQHNAKVIMDKSLDSVFFADELMRIYDNLLFLNVARDPRAQVSSMNRSIIYAFDTLLNAQAWVKAHDAAERLVQDFPERVLTIRYEDFIKDPELILQRICHFFGLQFSNTMLDIGKSQEAKAISTLSSLWKSNASAPILSNIDKFRNELTHSEITIIETLARKHMLRYGYEPLTDQDSVLTDGLVSEATTRSKARMNAAWNELRRKDPRDYRLRRFRNDYLDMVKQRLLKDAAETDRLMGEDSTSPLTC